MADGCYLEVDSAQARKHGQYVCGDVFDSRRLADEDRVVCVLADGLGSGIKASVLATLTGAMALRCLDNEMEAERTAALILGILPVCSQRKIAYSTFTLLDVTGKGRARLIESENPPALFLRAGRAVEPGGRRVTAIRDGDRERELRVAEPALVEGDRLILLSDGVTQAGLGQDRTPLGWGAEGIAGFAEEHVRRTPDISARALARAVIDEALRRDSRQARDDMTCAVVYVRRPRELLVVTGPPYTRDRDRAMAELADAFPGRRVICGGTTAGLVARELGRTVEVDLEHIDARIPPASRMAGVDLVTEGTLTLGEVARLLETPAAMESATPNAATRLVELMMDSDIIHFLVGTRINDAHQDPNVPVELDIRRNMVRRIRERLERGHLKETRARFL